jgi:DNA-binding NarL/FixJ family response regulator
VTLSPHRFRPPLPPTHRELEILAAVAQEGNQKDAARLLGVRPRTVHSRLADLYLRLDVHSAAAAVRVCYERGLLPPKDGDEG